MSEFDGGTLLVDPFADLREMEAEALGRYADYTPRAQTVDDTADVQFTDGVDVGGEEPLRLDADLPPAPGQPTVVLVAESGVTFADVTWPGIALTGDSVEEPQDDPDGDADLVVADEAVAADETVDLTYEVTVDMSEGVPVVVSVNTGTTVRVGPLAEGVEHACQVVAIDRVGQRSDPSPEVVFTAPTAPPKSSDGVAPASSPTPIVAGGTGWLHARWSPVANADPVTYRVYVTAAAGPGNFPLDATTFVGATTDRTGLFIKALADGSAPQYGVTYRVAIVASDADGDAPAGAEASGSTAKLDGGLDLVVGSITADDGVILSLYADVLEGGTISAAEIIMGAAGVLRSANYDPATPIATRQGWRLTDTTADLNNVTVRGTFDSSLGGTASGVMQVVNASGGDSASVYYAEGRAVGVVAANWTLTNALRRLDMKGADVTGSGKFRAQLLFDTTGGTGTPATVTSTRAVLQAEGIEVSAGRIMLLRFYPGADNVGGLQVGASGTPVKQDRRVVVSVPIGALAAFSTVTYNIAVAGLTTDDDVLRVMGGLANSRYVITNAVCNVNGTLEVQVNNPWNTAGVATTRDVPFWLRRL